MRASTSRLASGAAVAVFVAASIVMTTASAQAHNYLVGSNPEAGSVITEVPEMFSISTNDALLDLSGSASGFAIQVTDAAGLYYGDGCGVVDGGTYSSGATLGAAGDYRFLWQVISADGHTVSEEFTFTFEPSVDAVISEGAATPPVCGVTGVDPTEEPTVAPEVPSEEVPEPVTAEPDPAEASALPWAIGGISVLVVGAILAFVLVGRRRQPESVKSESVEPESAGTDPAAPDER